MQTILKFAVGIISLLCIACSGNQGTKNSDEENTVFVAGKIVDKIPCQSNTAYSYAMYLPVSFESNKNYPLIIVFDAHARGKLALQRFKEAADSYGYIVVASNEARNGIQDINPIVNALWDDIMKRLPIDKSRIYTAGFSGGARIAASIPIYKGGVKGVIGCGGGMPSPSQQLGSKFEFLGVVGLNDLNYQELRTLDKALTENGFINQLITFEGTHEWPDSKTLSRAVQWLDLMAIKQKQIPVNDALVRNYSKWYADTINQLIMTGDSYHAYLFYNMILKDLEGIYDISTYKESYNALLKNPDIEKNKEEIEKLKTEELNKQQQIMEWYKSASFSSLKSECLRLENLSKSENGEKFHQTKRLLGFMGMLSFLYTESALNSQNKANYLGYIDVYEKLEPKNPDILFFKACQSVMDSEPGKAMELLNKAVELGFYDYYRLQTIGYFEQLRVMPEFDIIVKKALDNFNKQK